MAKNTIIRNNAVSYSICVVTHNHIQVQLCYSYTMATRDLPDILYAYNVHAYMDELHHIL